MNDHRINACEGCIAYKAQNGKAEKEICGNCLKRTLVWKPEFYLECTNCGSTVGVDFNSTCEMDPLFSQNPLLILQPQNEIPANKVILELANILKVNALQMRKNLQEGYSVEIDYSYYDGLTHFLKENHIAHKFNNVVDLRDKYPFYKECKYQYSKMKRYL